MDLSIIIVNYNSGTQLAEALGSIAEFTRGIEYEVIVVDNNSQDESFSCVLQNRPAPITLIRNSQNLGFARANNLGMQRAQGRAVLLLNPDTRLTGNAFGPMLEYLAGHPDAGIVGCRIIHPDGTLQNTAYPFLSLGSRLKQLVKMPFDLAAYYSGRLCRAVCPCCAQSCCNTQKKTSARPRAVDAVTGACMMFRKQDADSLGGLDEKFFLYYEDEDFCRRMKQSGKQVVYFPSVQIIHSWGWGRRQKDPEVARARRDSYLYYCDKYYGSRPVYNFFLKSL